MDLLTKVFEAGVVGAGGAGFPTHVKLNATVDYFIINAVECEPLLYTDKYMMRQYSTQIVQAVETVGNHLQAKEKVIAIKKINRLEIELLEKSIASFGYPIRLFLMDNYYPAGDEQMVVYDVTGRVVPPGAIPLAVGAVVSNVATMFNIYEALEDLPVTHKYITVSGAVATPKVLKVPVGISFSECLEACGGVTLDRYKIVNGGPMMGHIYDKEELPQLCVTKTTSGILILDDQNFNARLKENMLKKTLNRAKAACIQCTFCTNLCPRKLTGHDLHPHKVMGQMSSMDFDDVFANGLEPNPILEEALICCECGICETYACPMGLYPRQVNVFVKKKYAEKKIRYQGTGKIPIPSEERQFRKVTAKAIMNRMGLGDYYEIQPEGMEVLESNHVVLPLQQHIGAPSTPVVSTGMTVAEGQLIAQCPENALGANLHASISGVVTVLENKIEIVGREDEWRL